MEASCTLVVHRFGKYGITKLTYQIEIESVVSHNRCKDETFSKTFSTLGRVGTFATQGRIPLSKSQAATSRSSATA